MQANDIQPHALNSTNFTIAHEACKILRYHKHLCRKKNVIVRLEQVVNNSGGWLHTLIWWVSISVTNLHVTILSLYKYLLLQGVHWMVVIYFYNLITPIDSANPSAVRRNSGQKRCLIHIRDSCWQFCTLHTQTSNKDTLNKSTTSSL